MLAILLESTETRCILSLDADEAKKDEMRQPLLQVPKAAVRRIKCGELAAVSFMSSGEFRLIRIDGSSDPEEETEIVSEIESCPSLFINT
jgi:hypothetical protein